MSIDGHVLEQVTNSQSLECDINFGYDNVHNSTLYVILFGNVLSFVKGFKCKHHSIYKFGLADILHCCKT